jgi:O-antigen/teichoic acid export membrane protein
VSLRRLLYHGAVYGLTTATARLLNWVLTPLYAHRLSVEDFGRMSELYAWMVFGLIVAGAGMETAYFRFSQGKARPFWQMLGLTVGVGGGIAGSLALAVPFIGPALGYADRLSLLWLTIAIWTVDAWGSFALAYQRALGRPARFAAIQLSHVLLLLGLNIWGVGGQGYGLDFILWANLGASLLRLSWALAWGPRRVSSSNDSLPTRLLLTYGLTLAGMGLLGATNDVLDRVLLARYDLAQTALYSAAYKIAMALALFVQAYRQAGEPLLLGESRGDLCFYRRSWLLYHAIGLSGVLLLSLWAPLLVTTDWGGLLPRSLFPSAYHAALPVVPILLWANLLMGSLVQASVWYKLQERPTAGLFITALGSLITWVGNLYGIPRYGYVASAWTTLLAYGGMVGVSVLWGRKVLPGAFPLGQIVGGSLWVVLMQWGTSYAPPVLLSGVGLVGLTWIFGRALAQKSP